MINQRVRKELHSRAQFRSFYAILGAALLLVFFGSKLCAQPQDETTAPPLSLETIEKLVKAHTASNVIIAEITSRGIGFSPIEDALDRLQRLGAGANVIRTLRERRKHESETLKKVKVIVAEFRPVAGSGKPITEILVEQLRDVIRPYSDVEVLAPSITITAQQGSDFAKEKAKQYGAEIIIWGWYSIENDLALVTVHFDVVESPRNLALINDKKTLPIPISSFEGFNVQIVTPLSSEMSYLTLLTLAFARLEAEDFDGAIAAFTKTLSLPTGADAMVDPADVYLGRAMAHIAKSSFLFIDETELTIEDLNKAISFHPEHSPAYSRLCGIYGERGEIQKAVSYCNKALAIAPGDPQVLIQRGRAYMVSGDFSTASVDLKDALMSLANDQELNESQKLVLSSLVHIFLSDTKSALSEISKAVAIAKTEPEYPYLLIIKTLVHGANNDDKAALETATEGLRVRPDLVVFYLFRAFAYEDLENYSEALKDINRFIAARPTLPFGYFERGEIYRGKDDPTSAINDYSRALELDPQLGMAYTGRARAKVDLKQYDKAITDFDRAVTAQKMDPTGYLYRGLAYVLKNDLVRAISDYDRYTQLVPLDKDGFSFRALAYRLQGQTEKALADYDSAIAINSNDADLFLSRGQLLDKKGEHDKAIADFDRALKINPSDANVFLNRGVARQLKGDLDGAIRDYDHFIDAQPSDPFGYLQRAAAHRAKGQLDQALLDYGRAIELRPELAESYKERADILYQRKALDQAITDYSKALQLKPDAAIYRQRGFVYLDKSNWDAAIGDFERARQLDPTTLNSVLAIGVSYEGKGDFKKAISFFNEYVAAKIDDSKGYFLRANAFKILQDWPDALADYNKAIELQRDDDLVFFNRGYVFEKRGENEKALADYSEAIKRNQKSAEYFFSRGSLYFVQKNLSSGVADLSAAIALDSTRPAYYYLRGLAYFYGKSIDAAIRDFSSALRLKPRWDKALLKRAIAYLATGDSFHARADLVLCIKETTDNAIQQQAKALLTGLPSQRKSRR